MKIVISFIFFGFLSVNAAVPVEEDSGPSTVDIVHERVSKTVSSFSYRIDKFFGSKRSEDSANGTQIKLAYITSKTESQKLDHGGIVKYKLKLPHLESLLKVSFSTDPHEPEEKKEGQKHDVQKDLPNQKLVKKRVPRTWSMNVNTGIKLEIPPQFFTNLSIRKSLFLGKWELRGAQEFFWFSRDGFGETTSFDIDRPIRRDILFRLRNSATWTDSEDKFNSTHGPIVFWTLDEKKAISFSASAHGTSKPFWLIESYQSSINYRQLLYKKWFYLETGPSIIYPKAEDWSPVMSYFLKLEVIFGNY
ncbi:MAG: hypothetical protein ACJAT2_003450 [Bacteriovoracaceae bacterium]